MSISAYIDLSKLIYIFKYRLIKENSNVPYMLGSNLTIMGRESERRGRWVAASNLNQVSESAFAALFAQIRRDL